MNDVTVDAEKSLIKVGGGAVWEDVDREAAKFGLATVGGTVNHTGNSGPFLVIIKLIEVLTQVSVVLRSAVAMAG